MFILSNLSLKGSECIKQAPSRVTGMDMDNKCVLVEIGSNRRPVVFKPENGRELMKLKQAVVESFGDILSTTDLKDLLVQVKSEEWGGELLDVLDSDSIPEYHHSQSQHSRVKFGSTAHDYVFTSLVIPNRRPQMISLQQLLSKHLLDPVD